MLSGRADTPFLLVLGEAGIGKSRLLRAAAFDARTDGVFVLFGSCLSMSGMPLLPINDVLRAAYEADGGHWLKDVLADCPRFVSDAIAPLVPEVAADGIGSAAVSGVGADPWQRQRLFSALRALLAALGRARPTALAVEDVHWADSSTLDLLEYLIAPGHEIGVPVVLTFRSEDDETPPNASRWLARAKRSQALEILRLATLSRTETAEQIELLTGEAPPPSTVDAIYRRSEGNALFTEQLIGSGHPTRPSSGGLPHNLAELFDSKLRRLGPEARIAARALAIAGRALPSQQLMDIADVSSAGLAPALHELKSLRLIKAADADDLFALRHALLGEAVVADMLPGERVDMHRRCAIAFATGAGGTGVAAETAEHWRLAGVVDEELDWSVRAAREAEALYASEQAASRWLRVLELWDHSTAPEAVTGTDLVEVYAAAEDALEYSGDSERAYELAKAALDRLAETASLAGTGDLYFRAGAYAGATSPQQGLDLLDHAIELYDQLPPSLGLLRVLNMRASLSRGLGRHDEATQLIDRALRVCDGLDVPAMRRRLLASRAWGDMEEGDPDAAISRIGDAYRAPVGRLDPITELTLAIMHTDILLKICAPSVDVERAAAPGFQVIADFGLDEFHGTSILRSNVADALIESGDLDRAAVLLGPLEHVPASRDFRYTALSRAELDMLHGDLPSARRRFTDIEGLTVTSINSRAEIAARHAELELWAGDPQSAYRRTTELLGLAAPTRESKFMGASLVLAARAAADLAELDTNATKPTNSGVDGADVDALRAAMVEDPLAPRRVPANAAAHRAVWQAERTRLRGESSAASWEKAALEWDRLGRPHRAAYCRWRQAEALITRRDTRAQATTALQQAAKQARRHAPLTTVIADLARRARIDLDQPITTTTAPTDNPTTPFELTDRELAVLRLLGDGLTNNEIGAALFISPKTASVHVTSIFRKLGVNTRAHAATVAARHRLLH
jgi:DNA-binding CsgD family transcriptional regulator